MKKLLAIFLFLCSWLSFSQQRDSLPLSYDEYILIKKGDTLNIKLDEISILPSLKFQSKNDKRYYWWFKTKVFKAYPYAVLASEKLDSLQLKLDALKRKRQKRRLVKDVQKYLEGEFSDQLKKMTKTEGRILIKLIHRQTGKTAYQNIRELRSGWRAFWYNTTANLFKLSLRSTYDPARVNEDYLIEGVLQRAFLNTSLKSTESKLDFDFPKIEASRKGVVNVEVYKKMFSKIRKRKKKK